ncbi:hypothetical protein [Fictibacillus terranigra]|uniref:YtzH-like protein n=1 Tax=Fictibacillus terranigra TaxID=3058424 RepID=A0ABT8EDT3_9BACL|nr:hypothetical protein [Fictibacillus sp. CENA-BCM004]MDN4076103.1 hypothetical protein [Fictibacillus sp. CENA-BCM004]
MLKTQTAERVDMLYSLLGQQLEERKYNKERVQKITELCQLLKEDVEVGEQTTEVFDDIVAVGQDALETQGNKESFLQSKEKELIEYYEHLKKLLEEQ